MSEPLRMTVVYEEGEDGWIVASIPAVPGVHSQGRTRDEARDNVLDALRLMLSPEPDTTHPAGSESLELSVSG
jgi:predicted RNase H-like HicB family nuclease